MGDVVLRQSGAIAPYVPQSGGAVVERATDLAVRGGTPAWTGGTRPSAIQQHGYPLDRLPSCIWEAGPQATELAHDVRSRLLGAKHPPEVWDALDAEQKANCTATLTRRLGAGWNDEFRSRIREAVQECYGDKADEVLQRHGFSAPSSKH
jgi:hypothetical protein